IASTRAPAKPLATNSRRAARRMRSRVRTGSRLEVTIWIPGRCTKYPCCYLPCQAGVDAFGKRVGGEEGGRPGGRREDAGRPAPPGAAFSSVLGGQALALHVAPELLRHLGGPDRRGAEQRLQAVRATPEADRVAAKRGLLAGRTLRHPLLLDRKIERLPSMTTTCGGLCQRKRR